MGLPGTLQPPTGGSHHSNLEVKSMKKKIKVVRQVTTFHLLDETGSNGASCSNELLIKADRALSDVEVNRLAQLVGYAWAAEVRGEGLGWPVRVSKKSFIVAADMTKSRRDDIGYAWNDFLQSVHAIVSEGSPVRKTSRSGPGTKGTRLLPGMPDIAIRVYADIAIP